MAPVDAFHVRVVGTATLVAPFTGELSVGAAGGGGGGGGAPTTEYKSLFGVPDGIPVMTLAVALLIKAVCTAAGVEVGLAWRYRAAAPATCGADIEVPEMVLVAVFVVFQADVMFTPGAEISTRDPKLEKEAHPSLIAVAPTVMASATSAGD